MDRSKAKAAKRPADLVVGIDRGRYADALAAVVGVPDDVRGEIPIAYVVVEDAVDVTQLEASCRAQLASFKVPRAFIPVEALPRTALGKVQKHLLPTWSPAIRDR